MEFTDKPLEPFGEIILDLAIPTQLSLKTALVFRMVKELVARQCLPSASNHQAELCFEEALSNAMMHGNKLDPSRKVRVILCADLERWGALIEDEGDGFKPSDIPDPNDLRNVLNETGRGIRLMDGYLDDLFYSSKGNRLLMIRRRQSQQGTAEAPTVVPVERPPVSADVLAEPVSVSRDGDVDILTVNLPRMSDEAAHALREAMQVATSPRLLLNLARVTFISSVGIGVMVHIYKTVSGRKGRVVLAGLQPAVRDTLKAVKMLTLFTVLDDREAGLAELRKGN